MSKLVKFCRIIQWIAQKDDQLSNTIQDLCMDRNLQPNRFIKGITFIFPASKPHRQKIIDSAYTKTAAAAIKEIESLILPIYIADGMQFRDMNVGTKRGVKLQVSSATAKKVTLVNGAVLSPAKDFETIRDDPNIAVWILESGEIPSEGPEYVPTKHKIGGAEPNKGQIYSRHMLTAREKLASSVEAAFNDEMKRSRCLSYNPYLSKVVSLLDFLRTNYSDLLIQCLLVLDRDPIVSFYLLLEPYKKTPGHLLETEVLFGQGQWNGVESYESTTSDFNAYFEILQYLEAPTGYNQQGQAFVPHVYTKSDTIRAVVDHVRKSISNSGLNKDQTPQNVIYHYHILMGSNKVDEYGPIFPEGRFREIVDAHRKLWQDEFRFIIHAVMRTILDKAINENSYHEEDFRAVVNVLRYNKPGNNYESELELCNHRALNELDVSPNVRFGTMLGFINSTDFLYVPVNMRNISNNWVLARSIETVGADAPYNNDWSKQFVMDRMIN